MDHYAYSLWEEHHLLAEREGWSFLLCTRGMEERPSKLTYPFRKSLRYEAVLLVLPQGKEEILSGNPASHGFSRQFRSYGLLHLFAPQPLPWLPEACREFVKRLPEDHSPWAWVGSGQLTDAELFASTRSLFGVDYTLSPGEGPSSPLDLLFLYLQEASLKNKLGEELQVRREWEREVPPLSPEALLALIPETFRPHTPPRSDAFTDLEGQGFLEAPPGAQMEVAESFYDANLANLFYLLRPEAQEAFQQVQTFGGEELPATSLPLALATLPWHPALRPEEEAFPPKALFSLRKADSFIAKLGNLAEVKMTDRNSWKFRDHNCLSTYRLAPVALAFDGGVEAKSAYGKLLQQWLVAKGTSREAAAALERRLTFAPWDPWEAMGFTPLLKSILPLRDKLSPAERVGLTQVLLTPAVAHQIAQSSKAIEKPLYSVALMPRNKQEKIFRGTEGAFLLPLLQKALGPQGVVSLLLRWERGEWGPLTREVVEEIARHPEWRGTPPSWWLPLLRG